MKRLVILDQDEWDQLPTAIGAALYARSQSPTGFTVVDKETGQPITDRLRDWLTGMMDLVFSNIEGRDEERIP